MRLGVPLRLDLRYFTEHVGERRRFGLGNFALTIAEATAADIARARGYGPSKLARSWYSLAKRLRGPLLTYRLDDGPTSFDQTFLGWSSPAYLKGYWIDERYFIDCESTIRNDFRITATPIARTTAVQRLIDAAPDSASIHVRRGDYLSPDNYGRFGELSPDWYGEAAQRIVREAPGVVFFVFSDDIAWVRANLTLPGEAVFVDHTDEGTCIDDLRLMSGCRHHIIPNSTFSWWGSWLGRQDGLVIAPAPWSPGDTRGRRAVCPTRWLRIPRR